MKMFHFRFRLRSDRPLGMLYALGLLGSLGSAVISPFLAIYFRDFAGVEFVGLIFAASHVVSILANIFGAKIIAWLHEKRALAYALSGTALAVFLIAFVEHVGVGVILFSIYTFLMTIVWFNVDLYIKHYSDRKNLSGNEGKMGVFSNIGWLIGPILGGAMAAQFGLPAVFIACSVCTFIGLILFGEARLHDRELRAPKHSSLGQAVRSYFADRGLEKLYLINFGLAFVYASWQFLPLLLVNHGLSVRTIGLVYGLSALPWVLLEYPVGQLADRRYGERGFIIAGFLVLALVSFVFGVAQPVGWLIVALFVGVIGSSLIERTHVAAFYRQVGEDDVERISVWRTASGAGYLAGALLAAGLLPFVPLRFYFGVLGVITLLFLANALAMPRSK